MLLRPHRSRSTLALWLATGLLAGSLFGARTLVRAEDAEAGSSAQADTTRIVKIAAQDNQVMKHLDGLVNGIGPRLTGSHNLERAYEWTQEQFKSFGLKNVHTEVWGEYPVYFDR